MKTETGKIIRITLGDRMGRLISIDLFKESIKTIISCSSGTCTYYFLKIGIARCK